MEGHALQHMWCFASITLCAIYCWTSSWTKVTSVNSWGFQSFPNCQCHLSGFECSLPLLRLHCELHIKLSVYKSESENINAKYKWYISILLFGFKAKIQIQTNTALFTSWLLCTTLPYAQVSLVFFPIFQSIFPIFFIFPNFFYYS